MDFIVHFCLHDTAATRGQYLALSKTWRSCCYPTCLPKKVSWVNCGLCKNGKSI